MRLCYPSDGQSTSHVEEAVCWGLVRWEQFLMAWLLMGTRGDAQWALWHSHGIPEHVRTCISPGATSGFIILTSFLKICLSLNLKATLCGSRCQWEKVRGDSLSHLPKSTGLLPPREGEVKAVLAHFCPLPSPGCCKHWGSLQICAALTQARGLVSSAGDSVAQRAWNACGLALGPPPPLGAYLMPGVAGDF